jgi:hypothetical protein
VERITRPCNRLKRRFEKFTTTRKGFAYMKCKDRKEGKKRWKQRRRIINVNKRSRKQYRFVKYEHGENITNRLNDEILLHVLRVLHLLSPH